MEIKKLPPTVTVAICPRCNGIWLDHGELKELLQARITERANPRFLLHGARIAFMCPVDIQAVMPRAEADEIRAYCRAMVSCLGTDAGGFIADWYGDPRAAGHSDEAIDAMCTEFVRISNETAARLND